MAVALKYFGVTAIFKSKYLRNTLFYCIMQINNLCVDICSIGEKYGK